MRKIGITPGDGAGSDVTAEAVKVLKAVIERSGIDVEPVSFDFDADRYLSTGIAVSDEQIAEIKSSFVALFIGALGNPKVSDGSYSRTILNELRLKLDLFLNFRPVKLLSARLCPLKDAKPEDINFQIFRDNLEGPGPDLTSVFKKGRPDEEIIHQSIVTRGGVQKLIQHAFEHARRKGLNRIAICSGQYFWRSEADLWTLVADEIARDYPEVEKTHLFLEDLISLMLNTPQELDLVVADCAFGQVVADIGAVIQGGKGLAFEADLNPGKTSLFMPADVACGGHQDAETANPLAAIAAIAALLDDLGLEQEAGWINGAIKYALETDNTTGDLGGRLRCEQVGDFIADQIKRGRSNKIS